VGYRELFDALQDEVDRQIHRLEADTDQECQRLLTDAHREVTAARQEALARERQRLDEADRRALGLARLEEARALLAEERRLLAELHEEAEGRLPALNEPALLQRLINELEPELGDGSVELRVDPGCEAALTSDLVQHHAALARRAIVSGTASVGGGVVAVLDGGRQILDNSLPSRLEKAWQQLESVVATDLFGECR
jgi:V/A-type H+/Na+-transporting ATPase subunit E